MTKATVTVPSDYSSANIGAIVHDEPRKPVLFDAHGKPLGKNPQRIGFAK